MSDTKWISEFRCRCNAISKMMAASRSTPCLTEKQAKTLEDYEKRTKLTANQMLELADLQVKRENGKKVVLSDGCVEYLMDVYAWETAKKLSVGKELNMIEYTEKGTVVEESSITLLSLVEETYYQKNDKRITNAYLSGEPDIFVGKEIMKAEKITDIKSSFDYPIFLKKINCPLDPCYINQVQGYCDITGAKEGEVAFCLVNMPFTIVNDYKRRLLYKMNAVTEESPEYVEAARTMEWSLMFDDIPRHLRVFKVKVDPFTPEMQQKVYDRVKICRDWLFQFHEKYEQLNK